MKYIEDYKITPSALAQELRAVAAEQPDVVAISQYAEGFEPGCIVGTALFNLGVPIEQLQEWDEDADGEGCEVIDLIDLTNNGATDEILWLSSVQSLQDNNYSWGEAVRSADLANGIG